MGAMHGRRMPMACTGCGRTDRPIATYECTWPDGRVSDERYCSECRLIWQRQLTELGATFHPTDDAPELSPATADGIRAIADYHQEMADRWRRILDLVSDGHRNS
jgi:hypothetical protein